VVEDGLWEGLSAVGGPEQGLTGDCLAVLMYEVFDALVESSEREAPCGC
jgi:hypothetical protein